MSDFERRTFLKMISLASAGIAIPSIITGCAIDPVTGEASLVLISEDEEIQIDKQQSPHQFSADYGISDDRGLNAYVSELGRSLHTASYRSSMPYSYQVVNANYVNAYAFPGGTIACTRGIMLEMESEAELAGLLGHEIGHVNARHSAERMSKGMLTQIAVGGLVMAAGDNKYAGALGQAGLISASALLAKYSRENEREADRLGMEFMAQTGQNPQGMVDLMDMLRSMSKHKPNAIELMFSSHPMSDERFSTAQKSASGKYADVTNRNMGRERYMDNTARLRKLKPVIEQQREAESLIAKGEFKSAESPLKKSLKAKPDDYPGLLLMAKTLMSQEQNKEALTYLKQAQQTNPREAQSYHLSGVADIALKRYDSALTAFNEYDKLLPGNPNLSFLKGFSYEGLSKKQNAANEYQNFLKSGAQGEQADYARTKLVDWGYL